MLPAMCSWQSAVFAEARVLLCLCHPVGWDLAAPVKQLSQILVPSSGLYVAKIKGNKLPTLQGFISVSASSVPDDTSSFTGDLNPAEAI